MLVRLIKVEFDWSGRMCLHKEKGNFFLQFVCDFYSVPAFASIKVLSLFITLSGLSGNWACLDVRNLFDYRNHCQTTTFIILWFLSNINKKSKSILLQMLIQVNLANQVNLVNLCVQVFWAQLYYDSLRFKAVYDLAVSGHFVLNLSLPDPGRREKINLNIIFSHFFVVPQKVFMKSLKAFTKPFEASQRSVKIKI